MSPTKEFLDKCWAACLAFEHGVWILEVPDMQYSTFMAWSWSCVLRWNSDGRLCGRLQRSWAVHAGTSNIKEHFGRLRVRHVFQELRTMPTSRASLTWNVQIRKVRMFLAVWRPAIANRDFKRDIFKPDFIRSIICWIWRRAWTIHGFKSWIGSANNSARGHPASERRVETQETPRQPTETPSLLQDLPNHQESKPTARLRACNQIYESTKS